MNQFFIIGKILLISLLFALAVRNISLPREHTFLLLASDDNHYNSHYEGNRFGIHSSQINKETIQVTIIQRVNLSDLIGTFVFMTIAIGVLSLYEFNKQKRAKALSPLKEES